MSAVLPALAERWDIAGGWHIFSRGYFRNSAAGGLARLPVVCVHGLSMSSRYMMPIARRLARDYDVCAPDLPGYGLSPHPERPLTIPALADTLRNWMDCLGLERAHLVGNSMGCQIISEFAARCPERAGRLALFGPSMDPRVLPLPRLGLRGAINLIFERASFYPVLLADYTRAGVRETFAGLQESIHDPMLRRLETVRSPTLVIRGTHDWLVTREYCQAVERALPRGRAVDLPGGGHIVHFSAPDAAAELSGEFFGEMGDS